MWECSIPKRIGSVHLYSKVRRIQFAVFEDLQAPVKLRVDYNIMVASAISNTKKYQLLAWENIHSEG